MRQKKPGCIFTSLVIWTLYRQRIWGVQHKLKGSYFSCLAVFSLCVHCVCNNISVWRAVKIRYSLSVALLLFLAVSSIIPLSLFSCFQSFCQPPPTPPLPTPPSLSALLTPKHAFYRKPMTPVCTPIYYLVLFSHALSVSLSLSISLLCREQYTGMGVWGVERGKVAFQRCQGHPVTRTCTHANTHTDTQRGCLLDNGYASGALVWNGALLYFAFLFFRIILCSIVKEFLSSLQNI